MLFVFPPETYGRVREDYERPYEDPIAASAGSFVQPVLDGSVTTDFMGWTWCIGGDGRAGWVPDSWCERESDKWRLTRDFNALELTVQQGDRLKLIYSESGFVMAETGSGERGWIPDAILALDSGANQHGEAAKATQPCSEEAK